VLARSIGLIGHALDQKRLQEPLYRHPWEDVLCGWRGGFVFVVVLWLGCGCIVPCHGRCFWGSPLNSWGEYKGAAARRGKGGGAGVACWPPGASFGSAITRHVPSTCPKLPLPHPARRHLVSAVLSAPV
jgi:hypothetical protein